jgi:dihydroorotate dehydrogenase electron transfer subunit
LSANHGHAFPHPPTRSRARVLANLPEGHGRKLRLAVPEWPGSRPGQFLMLGAGAEGGAVRRDPLLPRPMAVYRELGGRGAAAECAAGERVIEVLFRVVGRGTALLADLREQERVSLVGPLGRGFAQVEADFSSTDAAPDATPDTIPDPSSGPAILVGGGTGIASLYEWARELAARGRAVTVLLGARSAGDLLGWSDFEALGVGLVGTSEDGSAGVKGLVTVPLADRLRGSEGATVYAVGPTPMMRACADLAAACGARCYVSLENPMACGFGVCLGCAAPRRSGGYALVCRTGPVFPALEIDWAGLP